MHPWDEPALNQSLQRAILKSLSRVYPRSVKFSELLDYLKFAVEKGVGGNWVEEDELRLLWGAAAEQKRVTSTAVNLVHLEENGLCKADVQIGADGAISGGDSKITALGMDFLNHGGAT